MVVVIPQASPMFLFETGSVTAGNFVRFTELTGQPSFRDPLVSAAHLCTPAFPIFPTASQDPESGLHAFKASPLYLSQLPEASVLQANNLSLMLCHVMSVCLPLSQK